MDITETEEQNWPGNRCSACKEHRTPEGHDPCIANLPGVLYACCGHGNEEGYIKFEDGRVIRFNAVQVDLDLPPAKYEGVPVYLHKGNRIFNFETKKVELRKFSTIIRAKRKKE